MQMFFELGHSVVILFEDWNISSVGGTYLILPTIFSR